MIPILFSASETDFIGYGKGELAECTSCIVTEERNGLFEAVGSYPLSGKLYNEICVGAYILAKSNDTSLNQIFRIYKISRPINGMITLYCEHIRYSLSGVPVGRGTYSGTPAGIMSDMANSTEQSRFEFWSDISSTNSIVLNTPTTFGERLGGSEGSIIDIFGGEYEFDNFTVKLHQNRGSVLPVRIEYGKNLTGFNCESNNTNTYTHVYPYYSGSDGTYVELTEKQIKLSKADSYQFKRCYMLDLSSEFDDTPTQAQLKTKAENWIKSNNIDEIGYNYTLSFVPLWQTEEYKNIAVLERCSLCDTVTIVHSLYNIEVQAKIIKTVYDTLAERYTSMELGNASRNFANTVTQSINAVNRTIQSTKSFLEKSVDTATSLITGQKGGYVVFNPKEQPQEILILDSPSIETAINVWRWNSAGWGHSSTGYNGEYKLAATMDGKIVADFIAAGTLQGIKIICDNGDVGGWTIDGTGLSSPDGTIKIISKQTDGNSQGGKIELYRVSPTGKLDLTCTLEKGGVYLSYNDSPRGHFFVDSGNSNQSYLDADYISAKNITLNDATLSLKKATLADGSEIEYLGV